jgi:hypothetical protein
MAEDARSSFDLARARRKAGAGVVAGTLVGVAVFFLIFGLFAGPVAATKADRLGYAAQWLLLIALLLLAMTFVVAVSRNFGPAMDPTLNAESRFTDISRRVLTNTVEQGLIFALLAFAVAAAAPAGQLGVLAALVVLFVGSRLLFWIGYLIDPLYRSFGGIVAMLANAFLALWAIIAVLGYQPFFYPAG